MQHYKGLVGSLYSTGQQDASKEAAKITREPQLVQQVELFGDQQTNLILNVQPQVSMNRDLQSPSPSGEAPDPEVESRVNQQKQQLLLLQQKRRSLRAHH